MEWQASYRQQAQWVPASEKVPGCWVSGLLTVGLRRERQGHRVHREDQQDREGRQDHRHQVGSLGSSKGRVLLVPLAETLVLAGTTPDAEGRAFHQKDRLGRG